MFYSVCLFGRDDFEGFSLGVSLLFGGDGIVLGVDIEEFGFWWGSQRFFDFGFVEFGGGVLIDFGVDSAMEFFVGEVVVDFFGEKGFLHSH